MATTFNEKYLSNLPYAERRFALISQPLLPQEKGSKISIVFLFPSPAGEGLGVMALVELSNP
jgi:hypothetical protein